METPDFEKIAKQLRNPQGEEGHATANRMAENNAGMIRSGIDALDIKEKDRVLEMGFGGGAHLPYLLQKAKELQYTGVDISPTMTAMATEGNAAAVAAGNVMFQTVLPQNGYVTFPFEAGHFDHIFTVNTIYFWDNAAAQAAEIYRILQPGGCFVTCFGTEEFMSGLPFTQYGFNLYSAGKAKQLLEQAGLHNIETREETETVMSNAGSLMERTFILMKATK